VAWTEFQSTGGLEARVTRALARVLLERGEQFGLHLDDVEGLLTEVAQEKEAISEEPERRKGVSRPMAGRPREDRVRAISVVGRRCGGRRYCRPGWRSRSRPLDGS
jgi:hypothetical protein